ncbi:hypothetical protein D3C87_1938230 [compost metagenome]
MAEADHPLVADRHLLDDLPVPQLGDHRNDAVMRENGVRERLALKIDELAGGNRSDGGSLEQEAARLRLHRQNHLIKYWRTLRNLAHEQCLP